MKIVLPCGPRANSAKPTHRGKGHEMVPKWSPNGAQMNLKWEPKASSEMILKSKRKSKPKRGEWIQNGAQMRSQIYLKSIKKQVQQSMRKATPKGSPQGDFSPDRV